MANEEEYESGESSEPVEPDAFDLDSEPIGGDPAILEDEEDREQPTKPVRGLGHFPDIPDERDFRANALFGAVRNLRGEATLEEFVRRVRNQGVTNSCVGQAIANALHIRLLRMGYFNAPEPSPYFPYQGARILAKRTIDEQIEDLGCYARLAMRWIRDNGAVSEAQHPSIPSKVNEEPDWETLKQASAFRIQAWYRIVPEGRERCDQIAQAIQNGYPVIFAALVDEAFLAHKGKDLAPYYDKSKHVGGHMMTIVAFKTDANGRRLFLVLNSWGTDWGDGGFTWVDEAWLGANTVSDVYVFQVGASDDGQSA